MTFTAVAIDKVPNRVGDRKMVVGTYESSGSTAGGDINTGLRICEHLSLQALGTAVTSQPVVSAGAATAFPRSGASITIVTGPSADGLWMAYGR